jgi:DNA-binding winged helix-turn-helix (wHTH) protein/Flp pilus assembly protein TadD
MESVNDPVANQQILEFAGFRLDARQRKLFNAQGNDVPLNSRAYDTLLFLSEHQGETLSKQQLLESVWPNSVVEENNLSQAISALRKALGDNQRKHRIILTIPGRGYCFVPEVRLVSGSAGAAAAPAPAPDIPVPASPVLSPRLPPRPTARWLLLVAGAALLGTLLYGPRADFATPDPSSDLPTASAPPVRDNNGPVLHIDGTPSALRALGAELLPAEMLPATQVPTPSPEAHQAYLAGSAALVPGDYKEALRWFERAVELDPDFIEAQVSLSMLHTLMTGLPVSSTAEHRDQALAAARRALAINPSYGYAHAVLGAALHNNAQWWRAEDEYRLAREFGADVDGMEMQAFLLMSLGDFTGARTALHNNINANPANLNARGVLMVVEELLGNRKASRRAYEAGEALYPYQSWWGDVTGVWLALGRNDRDYLEKTREEYPAYLLYPVLQVLDDRDAALARLRLIHQDADKRMPAQLLNAGMFAAWYGDHALALDLLAQGLANNWISLYILWLPVFDDLRKEEGFKDLLRTSGIVDYWRKNGWPQICQPTTGAEFDCDWRAQAW